MFLVLRLSVIGNVVLCSGTGLTWEKHRCRMLVFSLFRALVKRYLFRLSPQNSLRNRTRRVRRRAL